MRDELKVDVAQSMSIRGPLQLLRIFPAPRALHLQEQDHVLRYHAAVFSLISDNQKLLPYILPVI